jgi:hypothetical protein
LFTDAPGELFDEQRVALGGLRDPLGPHRRIDATEEFRASSRPAASPSGSSGRAVYARKPAAPARSFAEKLGTRECEEEHRDVPHARANVSSRSSRLASAQWMSSYKSSVGLRIASDSTRTRAEKKSCSRSGYAFVVQAEEHREIRRVLLGRRRSCERGDGIGELLTGFGGVVAVEDLRGLLDLLTKCAVGGRSPVRGRSATDDASVLSRHELCQLERDSRLADPGRTEDRDEVAPPLVDDARPDSGEHAELAVAPDHRNLPGGTLPDG